MIFLSTQYIIHIHSKMSFINTSEIQLRRTIYFIKNGEMYNFVFRLILSQKILQVAHGFPEIIPFLVQLSLKLLEMNLQYLYNPVQYKLQFKTNLQHVYSQTLIYLSFIQFTDKKSGMSDAKKLEQFRTLKCIDKSIISTQLMNA